MADNDLDLEVKANSFRDYLNENKKARDIFVWIWGNFLSHQGKRLGVKIFALMFVIILLGTINTYSVRLIIDGTANVLSQKEGKDPSLIYWGFGLYVSILLLSRVLNYKKGVSREHFFADFGRQLNKRVSRLFFEKSPFFRTT